MTDIRESADAMVAEDLYELHVDDKRYELVNGELRVAEPPGFWHGDLQLQLGAELRSFVRAKRLGRVVTESGFVLRRAPDTVRAPDVAFVRADRVPSQDRAHLLFEGAPDLAAEIVSPSDAAWEIAEKVDDYLTNGVRLVWTVYPRSRQVEVWTPDRAARTLRGDDALDGADVIPGFRLPLPELFAESA